MLDRITSSLGDLPTATDQRRRRDLRTLGRRIEVLCDQPGPEPAHQRAEHTGRHLRLRQRLPLRPVDPGRDLGQTRGLRLGGDRLDLQSRRQAWYNRFAAGGLRTTRCTWPPGLEEIHKVHDAGATWNTVGPYWNFTYPCWSIDPAGSPAPARRPALRPDAVRDGMATARTTTCSTTTASAYERLRSTARSTPSATPDWKSLGDSTINVPPVLLGQRQQGHRYEQGATTSPAACRTT